MNELNTSILVIDDEELVRDNIEEILSPTKNTLHDDLMNEAASILFDTAPQPLLAPKTSNLPHFHVDKAATGMEGLEKVKRALKNGTPYAVIFLDMRMPGWDGLETAIKIREYDSKAEIIFITAYSDRSIDEIVERAGQNVGYHCKPYASEEIIQLATKAVTDYSRLRNLEQLMESISSIGLNRNQLNSLLKNILDQLAISVDTDMALLGKLDDDFAYEKLISIGLEEKINLSGLVERVKQINLKPEEVIQLDELVIARMEDYSVFAVLKKEERLKTERMYLLKLFVQNAAQAIRNAELNEKLLQKEKLSTVGNAVSMVMHDLRSPVKNVQLIAELMREEGGNEEWVHLLEQSAKQASEIFDDFLDFIKETTMKSEPLALTQLVNEAVTQSAGHDYAAFVKVAQDIHDEITILGDQSKLRRSISNIINNAYDALKSHRIVNPAITISVIKDDRDKKAIVMITDNGPGIPEVIARTLFEPFVTKDKSNGTGLGLAIAKQFVKAHGGDISVVNIPGASFIITLPL